MTISLSVADNKDGTGGVATVTGSAFFSENSLYYTGWTGEMKEYQWTLLDTRTGDGTIPIATPSQLPLGYYAWLLVNKVNPITSLGSMVYQNLTDGAFAVHYRILEAVRLRAVSLSLVGFNASKYQLMWFPRQMEGINDTPVMVVAPVGAESTPFRVNNQDDVGFPVFVGTVDAGDFNSAINIARDLKWRDQLARSLRYQRLAGVPEVRQVEWVPDAVVNPVWLDRGKIAQWMLFRAIVRQTRGLT